MTREAITAERCVEGPKTLMVGCSYCHEFIAPTRDAVDPDVLWCPRCERTIGVWTGVVPEDQR